VGLLVLYLDLFVLHLTLLALLLEMWDLDHLCLRADILDYWAKVHTPLLRTQPSASPANPSTLSIAYS
jgi:hypothetical protein